MKKLLLLPLVLLVMLGTATPAFASRHHHRHHHHAAHHHAAHHHAHHTM